MENKNKELKYTSATVWGRVLLLTYTSMPKLIGALSRAIKRKAYNSFGSQTDTALLCDELLTMIARKNVLTLVHKITGETLAKITDFHNYILTEKHLKNRKLMDVARSLDLSATEMFRAYIRALEAFSTELRRQGYYSFWFEDKFKCEPYILRIKERLTDSLV